MRSPGDAIYHVYTVMARPQRQYGASGDVPLRGRQQ